MSHLFVDLAVSKPYIYLSAKRGPLWVWKVLQWAIKGCLQIFHAYCSRCKKATSYCLAGDEACQLQPLSYSYNFLPLVSNLTLPALGQVDLFTMRGPLWASTTVQFSLALEQVTAPAGVEKATRDFFHLKRTSFNQAVIALVKPILGPQDIQLALNMKLYQQGTYSGSAVAQLLIYVSQYDF